MAMKLYYFNMKGRAETPRLVMKLGGKTFEDVRFSPEDWGAKYKAMSPSGQAPWLELDDGRKMCQSSAISMYCAGEAGMLPSDPFEVARTIELTNALEDVFTPLMKTFAMKDADEKAAARKELCEADGAVSAKMNNVEALVAACTTAYFCGPEATLADVHLFCFLGTLRSGFLDGITADYVDSFEKTAGLRSKVASIPMVKETYAGELGYEP